MEELVVHNLSFFFFFFLFLSMFYQGSHAQQPYLDYLEANCNATSSSSLGYSCNGPQSCKSFLTFRSLPPYNSAVSIAYLLGSEASGIALINNISAVDTIPTNKLIVVPVSCSCSGEYYQHITPYTVKTRGESYFSIANSTYQGLTTCRAVASQNKDGGGGELGGGMQLMIPVRCACPSESQAKDGVSFLMTYMIAKGDYVYKISGIISSIKEVYGVSVDSILDANEMSPDDIIYPFTPILIPFKSESCKVRPENFFCYCPNGYDPAPDGGEGFICRSEPKSFPIKLVALLGLGIGSGLLCISLCILWLYRHMVKRKHMQRKAKLFEQNGGLLLQQQISTYNGGVQNGKIFSEEDLKRATDNYNPSRVLGHGGSGTVYKGMLSDGRIVAIKKSKAVDSSQVGQFINEVAILSQINHQNVVKLLGCCLETEVPLLVYEFIPNGTLYHHIHHHHHHDQEHESSLTWERRLQIAAEVAGALSYMHSAASIPILHRDIKSSNILLDDKYNAKVSDFGTSKAMPLGQTHVTTAVKGTFGYLDPEYFWTSQFNEKSDVYSFGVVLVELLTSEKPVSFARAEEDKNLVAYFISMMEVRKVVEIVDLQVAKEAEREEIDSIANLALRCLRLEGRRRPTMKEVAMEIEGLRQKQNRLGAEGSSFWCIEDQIAHESVEIFSMEMDSFSRSY